MKEDDVLYALKAMHYIRRIESKAAEMYRLRFIYGFLHLYIGQVNFMINRINNIRMSSYDTIETEKKSNNKKKRGKKKERRKKNTFAQEAVATGMKPAISEKDSLITSYRCHGFAVVLGISARHIFAELMGRTTGTSKGKGGSMHMYGEQFYGGEGIVGGQV